MGRDCCQIPTNINIVASTWYSCNSFNFAVALLAASLTSFLLVFLLLEGSSCSCKGHSGAPCSSVMFHGKANILEILVIPFLWLIPFDNEILYVLVKLFADHGINSHMEWWWSTNFYITHTHKFLPFNVTEQTCTDSKIKAIQLKYKSSELTEQWSRFWPWGK